MVANLKETHEQQENQDNLNEFSEEKDDAKPPVFIDTVGNNGDNDSRTSCSETLAKEVVDNGIESEVVVGLPVTIESLIDNVERENLGRTLRRSFKKEMVIALSLVVQEMFGKLERSIDNNRK
ncbi:hypothetical protein Tco_1057779 [Tanacetum coccineum]|uniref:Uncharacterized protein n=1 Tax=Tanacetum coccineum TaxID=301880 RepID=A0ABQ5H845_9ASTR